MGALLLVINCCSLTKVVNQAKSRIHNLANGLNQTHQGRLSEITFHSLFVVHLSIISFFQRLSQSDRSTISGWVSSMAANAGKSRFSRIWMATPGIPTHQEKVNYSCCARLPCELSLVCKYLLLAVRMPVITTWTVYLCPSTEVGWSGWSRAGSSSLVHQQENLIPVAGM